MYKIIQTVHHDLGRKPSRTLYSDANDFYRALIMCQQLNSNCAEKNLRQDSIAVTYHFEYCPTEWED